jgi:toxin ParE1/3/4
MARKVIWAESALSDLEQTAEFIAKDSPRYAGAFVDEVRDAARSLARFSERGRVVPELQNPTVRELFVRGYRLIYQVREKAACILAFIHGGRDLRALWEHENRPPP